MKIKNKLKTKTQTNKGECFPEYWKNQFSTDVSYLSAASSLLLCRNSYLKILSRYMKKTIPKFTG